MLETQSGNGIVELDVHAEVVGARTDVERVLQDHDGARELVAHVQIARQLHPEDEPRARDFDLLFEGHRARVLARKTLHLLA
mgnify:CR=1 FL=1